MSTAGGKAAANDATVESGTEDTEAVQADRVILADEADAAVKAMKAKLAGWKDSLATAQAEAKRLRAQAQNGGQG